jgi:hypothetical protein
MEKRVPITGTIEENMFLALQQEQIMRDCGPFDPYYRIAKSNVDYYLTCASLLEKGERYIIERH